MDEAKYAEAVKCRQEIAGLQEDLAVMQKWRTTPKPGPFEADSIEGVVSRRFGLFIEIIEKRIGLIEDDFKLL